MVSRKRPIQRNLAKWFPSSGKTNWPRYPSGGSSQYGTIVRTGLTDYYIRRQRKHFPNGITFLVHRPNFVGDVTTHVGLCFSLFAYGPGNRYSIRN